MKITDQMMAGALFLIKRKQAKVAFDIGVPRSTINPLFQREPRTLRDREAAKRLHEAGWSLVTMPWHGKTGAHQYRERVLATLEIAKGKSKAIANGESKAVAVHRDAITRIADEYLFMAKHVWGPTALDSRRRSSDRLFDGVLCVRAIYDWVYVLQDQREHYGVTAEINDADAIALAEQVAGVLLVIAAEKPRTWYDGAFDAAKQRGARVARLLAVTAAGGMVYKGKSQTLPEKVAFMRRHVSAGFVQDSLMAERVCPGAEIARLYNAWVAAMMSGRWTAAAGIGKRLLTVYPEILESEVLGLKPIIDDPEVWPGLAAMLVLMPKTSGAVKRIQTATKARDLILRLQKINPDRFKDNANPKHNANYMDILEEVR